VFLKHAEPPVYPRRRYHPGMPETTPHAAENAADDIHDLERQRRANRDAVAALGVNPYGSRTEGLIPIADALHRYDEDADQDHQAHGKDEGFTDRRPAAAVAGRVMLHRDNGKLVWINLRDASGDLQIAVSKKDCDDLGFSIAKAADLGDLLSAEGPLMKTRKGEITVWASSIRFGAKSLAPPPEKWAGLQDKETRYRKRYVDLYANPEAMKTFITRSQINSRIRRFLDERGFLEVETPMIQPQAGGAAARPFVTTLNALDMTVSMRIAPELYLKRLLVGGMPRVYELNRNFRNEGVDRSHNPEFTSLEVYWAYADDNDMLRLTEDLIRELAHAVAVTRHPDAEQPEDLDPADVTLPFGDLAIDYGAPFAQITYADLFKNALGFPMTDHALARETARERLPHLAEKIDQMDDAFVVNELFEEFAEPTIDPEKPTFVRDYPAALSPLTRPKEDDPTLAGRWDLFIAGMEIGPAYTELNDPDVQAEKFREQLAGADDEESTFRTYDADFIEALKVGMPPAGGLGIGIDRLAMLLTNQPSIRDVILFPFMRRAEE